MKLIYEGNGSRIFKRYENVEEQCLSKHKGKYSYENFLYRNMTTKSYITCPEHGDFLQSLTKHLLAGRGCPKCNKSNKLTQEEVLTRAYIKYGDRFIYDMSEYKHTESKIKITCKEHNEEFHQTMAGHFISEGCPECISMKKRLPQEEFINKANVIHNFKYDYSKTVYLGNKRNVIITCPLHGDFIQLAEVHSNAGSGCQKCGAESIRDSSRDRNEKLKTTPTLFYVIKYKGLYKIGITIGTVKFRYRSDLVGDTDIEILYEKQFDTYPEALEFETMLKEKYNSYRYYGKRIFRNTGNTEVFKENIFELYLKEL